MHTAGSKRDGLLLVTGEKVPTEFIVLRRSQPQYGFTFFGRQFEAAASSHRLMSTMCVETL